MRDPVGHLEFEDRSIGESLAEVDERALKLFEFEDIVVSTRGGVNARDGVVEGTRSGEGIHLAGLNVDCGKNVDCGNFASRVCEEWNGKSGG